MKQVLSLACRPLLTAFLLLWSAIIWGQQFDIYVYDVKTGTSRQLSQIPGASSYNSSWANNSKKIAHDVVGAVAWPYNQSIFITDITTGTSIPLSGAEGGNDPAWSPDGASIAFSAWNWWSWTTDLYTVPAGGGVRQFLRAHSTHASWAPDGERLAFADEWYGYIGTMLRTGESETFVAYGQWPSWSPNGHYIAYNGWGGGVWVVRVDEAGYPQEAPRQLTTSGYGPTWKNNSMELVYIDWPSGDPDLYTVPVSGGEPVRVYGQTGGFDRGDYDPAYSNNGLYIAYSAYTDPYTVQSSNKASLQKETAITAITKLEQNYPNPFTSGTTISFHLAQPGQVILDIYNTAGQKVRSLASALYQPGYYRVPWNGTGKGGKLLESGLYFCRLQTGSSVHTITMTLVR